METLLGPSVRLEAAPVSESGLNYLSVRDALLKRAGLDAAPAPDDPRWVVFIEAGFSYVDEKCNAFVNALYWYDRKRQTVGAQARMIGDTSLSVLGHVHTAARTLSIVADAFSLTTRSIDNLYGSVLFSMPPATIQTMLQRLKKAHRDAVTLDRVRYLSQARAMTTIGDYLSLCLPPNIEARIQSTLNETVFISSGDGTLVGVSGRADANKIAVDKAGSDVQKAQERLKRGYISDNKTEVVTPTPFVLRSDPRVKNTDGDFETGLTFDRVTQLQEALCVTVDGDFGKTAASETRMGLNLFRAYQRRSPITATTKATLSSTTEAGDIVQSGSCGAPRRFENVYEKLSWGTRGQPDQVKIQSFNKTIVTALQKVKTAIGGMQAAATPQTPKPQNWDAVVSTLPTLGPQVDRTLAELNSSQGGSITESTRNAIQLIHSFGLSADSLQPNAGKADPAQAKRTLTPESRTMIDRWAK